MTTTKAPSLNHRLAEMLIGIIADIQNELGFSDAEKECSNGSLEIVEAIRRLKRDAQQPGVGETVRVSPNFGELINALHRASVGGHLHESIDRHYADFWFSPISPAPADSAPPAVEGVRRFIAERAVQPEFRQDVMDGDYDGTSWFQAVAAALAAPAPHAGQFADEDALVTFLGTLCEDGGQGGEWEVAQAAIAGIRAWQANVHPDDIAVDHFAAAMKEKLAAARAKGRSGWEDKAQCTAETLSRMLVDHVAKGDPRDVANFCMMLWSRGEGIAPPAPQGDAELRKARDEGHDSAIRFVLGHLKLHGDVGGTVYEELLRASGREQIIRSAIEHDELDFTGLREYVLEYGSWKEKAMVRAAIAAQAREKSNG